MYSTGTASGPKATLQALATFATSAGWTVNFNNTYTGVGWWLAVNKGSCYLNFVADTGDTQITVFGATGYNGSASYNAQPGVSPNSLNVCNSGVGPYAGYHFFSTTGAAAYLHVVIERSAGLFAHIHTGALNAVGGASPCIYLQVTNWTYTGTYAGYPDGGNAGYFPWSNQFPAGWIGVTVDSTFRWLRPNGTSPARATLPLQVSGLHYYAMLRSPNTFNGLAALLPIECFVERAVGSLWAYVGDAPDMRLFNITNNNPKDEITIGSDTWKVFPYISNAVPYNNVNLPASSGPYAVAMRKNA
ncbi:MAG TPA: hypothetical protein VF450_08325 [Noviherbaspirillum sp.]